MLLRSLAANEELNRAVADLQISVTNLELHVEDLQLQVQILGENASMTQQFGISTPRHDQEQDAGLDAWYENDENVHPGPPARETDLTSSTAAWPTTIDQAQPISRQRTAPATSSEPF